MNDMTGLKPIERKPGHQRAPIYFDYQATTPCDRRVVEAMLPYFTERFGNPHSRNHDYGWAAEEAVEIGR
ncbi:MAG: aminotransferase class V-fold PLP-dependent enzyme, partial [Rhodospirillales bacterium]